MLTPIPCPFSFAGTWQLCPLVGDLDNSLTSVQQRTSHLAQVQSLRDRTNAMDTDVNEDGEEHDQGKMAAMDAYHQFTDTRLQRMIVDWLCRMGFISSAERLANSKKLEVSLHWGESVLLGLLLPPHGLT